MVINGKGHYDRRHQCKRSISIVLYGNLWDVVTETCGMWFQISAQKVLNYQFCAVASGYQPEFSWAPSVIFGSADPPSDCMRVISGWGFTSRCSVPDPGSFPVFPTWFGPGATPTNCPVPPPKHLLILLQASLK